VVCDEYLRLLMAHTQAMQHYRWALNELEQRLSTASAQAYAQLLQIVEDVKLHCGNAREEMNLHREEHGCR
jgi:hypothetical protein